MPQPTLEEILKTRFGHHRGIMGNGYIQNSLDAIKAAVDLNPQFVEFDISLVGGVLRTGHPPQEPLDKLADVLCLFENKKTYPKIDIKPLTTSSTKDAIDQTLEMVGQKQIAFALLNLGRGHYDKEEFVEIERYLASKIQNNPAIQLNADVARFRPCGSPIDRATKQYLKSLGPLFSISPEIHQEDPETMMQLAQDHGINAVGFWLSGWPDTSNPLVTEETIQEIFALEKKYPDVSIFFDINPAYVIPNTKAPT